MLRGAAVAHMTVCKFAFMKTILSNACATKLTRNMLRLQSQKPSSHSSLLPSAVEEHGSHALGHTL